MKMKRFLAMAMAGVLTLTPVTAFGADTTYSDPNAASGSVSGNGAIEAIIDKDVFNVVLPTYDSEIFDFKLDPQGVVSETAGGAYAGQTTEASLFFVDPTDDSLSSNSAAISVYNKSSYEVDVALTAAASGLSTATLADSSAFSGENTDIYLALQSGDDTAAITANGASLTKTLGVMEDAYEVKYSGGSYSYGLTSTAAAADVTDFPGMSFNLTGACNTAADWTALEDITPSVEVSWTISKHEEVTGPQATLTSAGLLTVTGLTADKNYSSMASKGSTKTTPVNLTATNGSFDVSQWSSSTGGTFKYQLNSSSVSYYAGETVTITLTLTDGSTVSASAQF